MKAVFLGNDLVPLLIIFLEKNSIKGHNVTAPVMDKNLHSVLRSPGPLELLILTRCYLL